MVIVESVQYAFQALDSFFFFFCKQKTAYEMRISDWSSDVCSSDLAGIGFILLDELMGRVKLLRFPPLAVGIGIYLPMTVILPVVIGALLGWLYNRWALRTDRKSVV